MSPRPFVPGADAQAYLDALADRRGEAARAKAAADALVSLVARLQLDGEPLSLAVAGALYVHAAREVEAVHDATVQAGLESVRNQRAGLAQQLRRWADTVERNPKPARERDPYREIGMGAMGGEREGT